MSSDPVVAECAQAWAHSESTNYTSGALLYCNLDIAQPEWATPDKLIVKLVITVSTEHKLIMEQVYNIDNFQGYG